MMLWDFGSIIQFQILVKRAGPASEKWRIKNCALFQLLVDNVWAGTPFNTFNSSGEFCRLSTSAQFFAIFPQPWIFLVLFCFKTKKYVKTHLREWSKLSTWLTPYFINQVSIYFFSLMKKSNKKNQGRFKSIHSLCSRTQAVNRPVSAAFQIE